MPSKVDVVENRGDEDHPYGFVYFDDGGSCAFAYNPGIDQWHLTDGAPRSGPATPQQRAAALLHLEQHGTKDPDDTTD